MKKIILTIIIGYLFGNALYSQSSECISCNWDWTGTNTNNWTFIKGGGLTVQNGTGSPWSSDVPVLNTIQQSEDYTTVNGWVLLHKDFGCLNGTNYPYFFLYNKYTGKIRLFMYRYAGPNPPTAIKSGLVKIEWNNPSKFTSLLSLCNREYYVNQYYHQNQSICNDVGVYTLQNNEKQFYANQFFVADFNTAFDPEIPKEIGYQLNLDIQTIMDYKVQMTGGFDWTTRSLGVNESLPDINSYKPDPDDGTKNYDYIYNGISTLPKFTASLPTTDDLTKLFGEQYKKISDYETKSSSVFKDFKSVTDYKNTMYDMSVNKDNDFVNFLKSSSTALPVIGKYVKAGLSVFDFFSGKSTAGPQEVKMMPTISHGSITLSGNITANSSEVPIIFDLPGSPHSLSQPDKIPLWDCPLGVISLQEDLNTPDEFGNPGISRQMVKLYAGEKFINLTFDYKNNNNGDPRYITKAYIHNTPFYQNFDNYRINKDLKFNLNPTSDVSIISLKAAIVGRSKTDGDGIPWENPFKDLTFFNIDPKTNGDPYATTVIRSYGCNYGDGLSYLKPLNGSDLCIPVEGGPPFQYYFTPANDYAERGEYLINSVDENGVLEISTPFIDVEKFKGTSILLHYSYDLYLKVIAVLKPNDPSATQTPIILEFKYKIDNPEYETQITADKNGVYPYTAEEYSLMDLTTHVASGNDSKMSETDLITAGEVHLDSNSADMHSDVIYKANRSIKLNPGFSAKASANWQFQAVIDRSEDGSHHVITTIPTNFTPLSSIVNSDFHFGPNMDNQCKCTTTASSEKAKLAGENSFENLVNEAIQVAKEKNGIEVYPTLTTGNVNIDNINLGSNNGTIVQVFNSLGNSMINLKVFENKAKIDLARFSNGIYIIKVIQSGKVKTFKVVKN